MKTNTKYICITGIGIALFVALSLCLRVPVFENFYLCLGYVVMTVYCYTVGTLSGTLVGTLGTILYCLLINGLRGMPGWALGNVFIGIALGFWFNKTKNIKKENIKKLINFLNIIVVIFSTMIGILGIKSFTEYLLYSQPFLVRAATNMYAFIADAFVIIVSIPISKFLDSKLNTIVHK